jgi:hypothetical protein
MIECNSLFEGELFGQCPRFGRNFTTVIKSKTDKISVIIEHVLLAHRQRAALMIETSLLWAALMIDRTLCAALMIERTLVGA